MLDSVGLWGQTAVLESIRCHPDVTAVYVGRLRPRPCLRLEVHFDDGCVRWGIMWANGTVTGEIAERVYCPAP